MSMDAHFLRQRRNVFISGLSLLALIFFHTDSNTNIKNSMIQWIEISPIVAIVFMIFLFYYFSLRYIQYFLDDDISNKLYRIFLSNNFSEYDTADDSSAKLELKFWNQIVFFTKYSMSWHGESWSWSVSFDTFNRRGIRKHIQEYKGKDLEKAFKYLYKITSFRNIFFKNYRTFLLAITNRKYGDYTFPIIFLCIVWLIVLCKSIPILYWIILKSI